MFYECSNHTPPRWEVGMNKNDNPDKAKDSPNFDFEKTIKIITTLSFAVGLVIYSFTIGYFHRLEIPGTPTFLDSIRFYLHSTLKNLYEKPEIFIGLVSIVSSVYFAAFSKILTEECLVKKIFKVGICILFFAIPLVVLNREMSLFAPVILSVVLGSVYFIVLDNPNISKEKKVSGLVPYGFLTIALSYWAFSTIDLSFFDKTRLNSYFPNGFGIANYEPSNLLWSEENKNFWYNCQEQRGVIYGTKDDEKIFIRTEMSYSLNEHLCSFSE